MRLTRQPRQMKREYEPLGRVELCCFGLDIVIYSFLYLICSRRTEPENMFEAKSQCHFSAKRQYAVDVFGRVLCCSFVWVLRICDAFSDRSFVRSIALRYKQG